MTLALRHPALLALLVVALALALLSVLALDLGLHLRLLHFLLHLPGLTFPCC